jgi:hypothetical protein
MEGVWRGKYKLVPPLWKSVWTLFKKLNDPVIPFLGTYSKETKSAYYRDTYSPSFIVALFTIATKLRNQPRCPSMDEWIKKIYIYTMELTEPLRIMKWKMDGTRDHHIK